MSEIIFKRNLVYKKTKKESHCCDIFLPKNEKEGIPIIIFLHGGSFHTGSKEMYYEWGEFLASNGVAVINVNYSLATPTFPTYDVVLDDVNDVIKFIVDNANEWGIDPYNIAISGDSAGGYLAALATLKLAGSSFKIKACIPVYGVFDLAEWDKYTDQTRSDVVVKKFLGASYDKKPKRYEKMNILNMFEQAKKDPHFDPDFLVIYGEKDDVVLYENHSTKFIEQLKKYNLRYEVIAEREFGHFWFTPPNENKLLVLEPTNRVCFLVLDYLNKVFKQKFTFDIHLYEV